MNPISDFSHPLRHRAAIFLPNGAAAALAIFVVAGPAQAADVTLGTTNGIGTSSFESATSWSNAAAPSAGNAYLVPSGLTLRTPADSAVDHTFAGDSLKLTSASLVYKGGTNNNVISVNNLTLDASLVNNASNTSTAFTLGGSINIAGTGTSTIFSNNATITVTAPISGNSGTLLLQTNTTTGRQVILTAANTYTGNIQVTGNSGAVLTSSGKLAFAMNSSAGAYNSITGAAPFEFSGVFTIDLTGAGTNPGDSHQLVNTATIAENFTATFAVEGWTKIGDVWVSPNGNYQFIPSSGVLVRVEPDVDLDGLPDAWEIEYFGSISAHDGDDDPDGDFSSNLAEYNAFTEPDDPASFPDSDFDGLPDGWETFYFTNLTQGPLGDPDGDFSSNEAEYAALTDPTTRVSFPDADADLVGDDWEIRHFGSIAACDPEADPDGDLFTNRQEFDSATNPKIQVSSPDYDLPLDGLPDGWEVKYFRAGNESLEQTILHTDGMLDSDGDGSTDAVEYHAGTNPKDSSSYPGGTAAYWRFEEKTTGLIEYPQVATAVKDVTNNGNDMMTWADYTAPSHITTVLDDVVTNTGAMNGSSLVFTEVDGNRYTSDNIYTSGTAPINAAIFNALTVEASFRPTRVGRGQGIIGKSGNPTGMAAPYQAPFTLKLNAENHVVAGLIDGSSTAREVISVRTVSADSWYSAAVTVSPTQLSLWLKAPGDTNYVLESSLAISGAWYPTEFNRVWVIGQTEYDPAENGGFGGYYSFNGEIDEVRISPTVLGNGKFLANVASGIEDPDSDGDAMGDAWELEYFGSLGQTAAGDFDGDGTTNIVEYLTGLSPVSGSSRFAGTVSGNTITWPAKAGVSFTVQRSATMADEASWADVATVVATGTTATWTDLVPPSGKAFYRIVLPTP
ncbi:LamG-like jellyroll fold domain-containing protein [Luteolibacter luteus]|uniref:LamG domain-containing protein n=1 Tax=Luteolibacter luteus TaxID=2728835 RepID=A0A858RIJ7_9BACT|nr:LamG-like jellyroll fold domain-containing protein [Luteolibacter luteus]QJE96364.1 LamG domain-containing protein [Luteolibacter luteus]